MHRRKETTDHLISNQQPTKDITQQLTKLLYEGGQYEGGQMDQEEGQDYSDNRYVNPSQRNGSAANEPNQTEDNDEALSKMYQKESAADLDDQFGLKFQDKRGQGGYSAAGYPEKHNQQSNRDTFPDQYASIASARSSPAKVDAYDEDGDIKMEEEEEIEKMASATDFVGNMKTFINNYGVSIDIPNFYPQGAAIFPKDPTLVLQLVQYVIPKPTDKGEVYYRSPDEEGILSDPVSFIGENEYPEEINDAGCIQLIQNDGRCPKVLKEVYLPQSKRNMIAFSPNGEYLVVFRMAIHSLDIYRVEDAEAIHDVIEKMENNGHPDWTLTQKQQLDKVKRMKFDPQSRYLALYGSDRVRIIQLDTEDYIPRIAMDDFKLRKNYKSILDLQIRGKEDEDGYICEIACLHQKYQRVQILNIDNQDQKEDQKIIIFEGKTLKGLKVRIADDFKKVMFCSKQENYVLEYEETEEGMNYNQNSLNWLDGKNVLRIQNQSYMDEESEESIDSFFVVYCDDFSQMIHARHVHNEAISFDIERNVEPSTLKVYDCFINSESNDYWICLIQDQKFLVFKIPSEQEEAEDEEESKVEIASWEIDLSEGFSSCWPFITYKGVPNFRQGGYGNGARSFQILFNAENRNELIRIEMPEGVISQPFSYVTETFELYIICEYEESYEMYQVDLNDFEDKSTGKHKYRLERRLTIDRNEMDDLQAFHVRGGDLKHHDDISANNKSIAFFIFNNMVYYWMQGMEEELKEVTIKRNKEEVPIKVEQAQFDVINDSNIVLSSRMELKDMDFQVYQILQISIDFSTFEVNSIYEESEIINVIINYGFDEKDNCILFLKKDKSKEKYYVSIVEVSDDTQYDTLYNNLTTNEELIGRLRSGFFMVVNGFIYYNNDIIKIRYDLLKDKNNTTEFAEELVFDWYQNILQFEKKPGCQKLEYCETDMPVVEINSERLIYIVKNAADMTPKRLLLMPFLHNRNVLMKNLNPDHEYFSTILSKKSKDDGNNLSMVNHYITMSLSDLHVQVFSPNGFQTNKFDILYYTKLYGKPKAVSNNGQFFIFAKKKTLKLHILALTNLEMVLVKTCNLEKDLNQYLEEGVQTHQGVQEAQGLIQNILHGKHKNFGDHERYAYTFLINDNLDICVKFDPIKPKIDKSKVKEVKPDNMTEEMLKNLDRFQLKIEENKRRKQMEQEEMNRVKMGAFFYIQKGSMGLDYDKLSSNSEWDKVEQAIKNINLQKEASKYSEQYCFMIYDNKTLETGVKGFSMNTKHLFLWNVQKAWKLQIRPSTQQELSFGENIEQITLFVDPEEQQTKIKTIITGPSEDIAIVVIKQTTNLWSSLVWSIKYDNEIDQFDHKEPPDVFWGTDKKAAISEGNDKIYIPEMGCVIKAFRFKIKISDLKQLKKDDKQKNMRRAFGNQFGVRFDGDTHSLILMDGIINLSYSYMTFMMQSVDEQENDDYQFDVEEYNYLINKRTALHDMDLLKDASGLQYVLKNLERIDPQLLEMLQYYYIQESDEADIQNSQRNLQQSQRDQAVDDDEEFVQLDEGEYVTPLHIALALEQTRSVNIILKFQALLDYSSFNTFKSILPDLIEFKNFNDYLIEQPFETVQLSNKQSLKANDMITETIVQINHYNSSYVDESYYKNVMQEDKLVDANTYPVNMKLVEVGWLLNEQKGKKYGLKFLQAVYNSENFDLYDTDTIKITVEYLYMKYSQKVSRVLFPIYLVTLFFFLVTLFYFEYVEDEMDFAVANKDKPDPNTKKMVILANDPRLDPNYGKSWMVLIGLFNLLITLVNIAVVVLKTYHTKESYWNSQWAYIDSAFCFFNFIIVCLILNYEPSAFLRYLEAVTAILLGQKSLYFLEMNDKIAPLINILYQVLTEIQYFILVILIMFCAFASAFYLLGQNQVQFDDISTTAEDGGEVPLYITAPKAILFMFYLLLGEVGPSGNFDKGKNSQEFQLWFFFCIATFFFIIVMMNMLVAIMGEVFTKNYEVEEQNVLRTKLRFVIDNWIFSPFDAKQKTQIQYLVAAILNDAEEEETEAIKDLNEKVADMKMRTKQDTRKIMTELKKIKSMQS